MNNEVKRGSGSSTMDKKEELNAVYDYYLIVEKVKKLGGEGKIRDFKFLYALLGIAFISTGGFITVAILARFFSEKTVVFLSCGIGALILALLSLTSLVLLAVFSKREHYEKIRAQNADNRKTEIKGIVTDFFTGIKIGEKDIDFLRKKTENELKEIQEKIKVSLIIIFLTTLAVSGAAVAKEFSSALLWRSVYIEASNFLEKEEEQTKLDEKSEVDEEQEKLNELIEKERAEKKEQIREYKKEYGKSYIAAVAASISFLFLASFVTIICCIKAFRDMSGFDTNRNMEYLLLELQKYDGEGKASKDTSEPDGNGDCGVDKNAECLNEEKTILSETNTVVKDQSSNRDHTAHDIKKQNESPQALIKSSECMREGTKKNITIETKVGEGKIDECIQVSANNSKNDFNERVNMSKKRTNKDFFEKSEDRVLIQADRLKRIWFSSSIIWKIVDLVFAIGAFAASVAVILIGAIEKDQVPMIVIIILSAISAIFALTGFACASGQTSSSYRAAFQLLYSTIIANIDKDGNVSDSGRQNIIRAMIIGERILGKTYGVDSDLFEINSSNDKS